MEEEATPSKSTKLTQLETLEIDMGKMMQSFTQAINVISDGRINNVSLKKMAANLVGDCQKIDKTISQIDYLDLEED